MSDTGNSTINLFDEQVTFIQHHLPGLDAGEYTLTLEQTRTDGANNAIGEPYKQSFPFAVKGDRFRMSNPGDLYAVFPPTHPPGEFDMVLPHVVFSKKTFPWMRYPNNEEPARNPQPGKDVVDQDVPTWLTILLLDEDDVSDPANLMQQRTINDLFPAQLGPNGVSYFPSDTSPLDYGEARSDQIQTIDLPLSLFWKIAPTLADLNYLAHARAVSLLPKVTMGGISDGGEPVGDFSIVFGNRLPQDGKRSYAFLVSLETLENYLPDNEGRPQSGKPNDGSKFLRLAVLKNWHFDSFGSPASFDRAVLSLNGRDPDKKDAPAVLTTLQAPYAGSNPQLRRPLQMGYVPMNHRLRTGEKTVSWYRGPLTPYLVDNQRINIPISSPDQATSFDPSTGMFDVSYAAAWTLGRQLALQDAGFSTALYQWKKGLDLQAIARIEGELIAEKFESVLQPGGETAEQESLPPQPLRKTLYRKTLELLLK